MAARAGAAGILVGGAGLVAGFIALLVDGAALGAVAGGCAVGAGVLAYSSAGRLTSATSRSASLEARVAALEQGMKEALEPPPPRPAVADARPPEAVADHKLLGAERLTDPATGLFNEEFFRVTLEARVSSARRHLRPVGVVILDVRSGVRSGKPVPVDPDAVAMGIRTTLREADTSCRLGDGRFGLILEDTPENGAVWTVERVRRRLAAVNPEQTLWAGVACYPAHAFDAEALLERARQALKAASEWRQDRIEIATPD